MKKQKIQKVEKKIYLKIFFSIFLDYSFFLFFFRNFENEKK